MTKHACDDCLCNMVPLFFPAVLEQVNQASESLLNGNIIAVPTDTIYGVAGLAQNSEAVKRIYNVKRRSLTNPIAISVGRVGDIHKYVSLIIACYLQILVSLFCRTYIVRTMNWFEKG